MAEFALGLTKMAVEGTVSRVKSAIEEEEKLKVRVQNDLVFITGEFQMMQTFLNVANKERAKNEVVRMWVRQIRDLAFDVEDCIELVVSLDVKSGYSWLWRMLPDCMTPSRPLDDAVANIERLKARVEDVSHRNARYNLIGDSGSGSDCYTTALALPATSAASASSAAFHILHEVWEAAGKMRPDMGDLKKVITSEGIDSQVISLWASPGSPIELGTTSIVQKVYNDPEICQEFKIRVWVKLMHPFNLDEFLKSFLTQLYAISSHHDENLEPCFRTSEEYHLIKPKLMQLVNQQRYLVIVEQLSTIAEWEAIRLYLPNNKKGSRIVVTTQQLVIALSCTGKPYQVSDLWQFSDGQSLCAIFNKVSGCRSDMGEFIWQLKCGGVISMWSNNPTDSSRCILDEVYAGLTHKSKGFEGVEFERHNWVDVPDPFDLGVFSRRLFLNFYSDDLRAKEIISAGVSGDAGVIQGCQYFLREQHCLVVINGLNFRNDWDLIKAAFLSEPTKGCILVIGGYDVAHYCVAKDYQVFPMENLDADMLLRRSIEGCKYYGIEANEASSRGRFFSNRMKQARDWMDKFELVVGSGNGYSRELRDCLQNPGVISLCGIAGAWKSSLAMKIYYEQMLIVQKDTPPKIDRYYEEIVYLGFSAYSWVNVPHPFNLMDFCLRLYLDFFSNNPGDKEDFALWIMEGRLDPIKACLEALSEEKCFVVIDGLRSKDDWDLIKDALLPGPIKGCILLITDETSVATHCVHEENRVIIIDGKNRVTGHPLMKKKGYSDKDRSHAFSSRMIEARHWTKEIELVGREDEPIPFFYHSEHNVYSVWGFAGVGKSAIVRSRYFKHMSIYQDETTKFGWVDVPQTFSLTGLSRCLLVDFHSTDLESKETAAVGMMEGQDPIQGCRKILEEGNYIVVIDGLRSTHDWDLIKANFLSEPIKGSLVVVTNKESVAKHCVDQQSYYHVNIKGLKADAALNLYTKIAWNGKQLTWEDQELLSRLTVTKCGGLPKVIAAIGKYHRESCRLATYYASGRRWIESVNSKFMEELETTPDLRGLFSWVQSYFDDCPDSLKPCIFYLSIFPSGQDIRPRRLLRRWIAEGYSRDTPGSLAETNATMLFYELSKLSIIQRQYSQSNLNVWRVNGFFREYIISREMQDNLVFELEGHCSLNTQHVGQHLTISSTWDRDKLVFESMDLSCLRSLTVFGEWRSFFISTEANMRLLRVLDLEDTSGVTDGDLEQIGKVLPRLKFLSLRGCKDITRLPSSLGGLRQLQTLDIKGTSIATLPPAIMKLEKLQCIRAGITRSRCVATSSEVDNGTIATPVGVGVGADGDGASTSHPTSAADEARTSTPRSTRPHAVRITNDGVQFFVAAAVGIGKWTALHTLAVVNVGSQGGKVVLKELRKLTHLRKLGLSGISPKNWHDLCSVVDGHCHLVSLSVRLELDHDQGGVCCLGDISKPPVTLRTLKMFGGNVHVSPVWMKQLDDLHKVDLGDNELTISTQEDIDSIMELRCMHTISHICVKPIKDGEIYYGLSRPTLYWWDFRACKVLKIDCGGYRLALVFGHDMPRYVEVLVVHCSTTESSLVVSQLEYLTSLKEIWLKGSYSDAVKQHLQQRVRQHQNKPVLKLD